MARKKCFYRQCRLEKKTPTGKLCQVSFIPAQFAVKDKVLKLREGGVWENGWVVIGAGSELHEDVDLPDSHQIIKGHRKNTGDSLPKNTKKE